MQTLSCDQQSVWLKFTLRLDWVEKRKRGRRGRWSRGKAVRFGVGADRTLDRVPPASEPRAGRCGPLQRCSGSGVRWEACGNSEFGALPTVSGSVGLGGARGLAFLTLSQATVTMLVPGPRFEDLGQSGLE